MTLIPCPDCGHQVSPAAPACVSCGHPIAVYRPPVDRLAAEKTIAHVGYGLLVAGYLNGLTWIAAVILAYVKRNEVRGTWLESHFDWQIDTFWWVVVLGVGLVVTALMFGVGAGGGAMAMLIIMAGGLGITVWTLYRIIKGWMRLSEGKRVD